MKNLSCLLTMALIAGASTSNAATGDILSCWDSTFAYTTAVIKEAEGQSNLLRVELASENQAELLKSIKVSPRRGWGQAKIAFYIPKTECKETTPGRGDLMTCETKNGILEIDYDESIEVRKSLRLVVRDLKLETALSGQALVTNLSFDAGSIAPGAVNLSFRTTPEGTCHSLN